MEDKPEVSPSARIEEETKTHLLPSIIASSFVHYINNKASVDLNLQYLEGKIDEIQMVERIKEIHSFTKKLGQIRNAETFSEQKQGAPIKDFPFNPESTNQAARGLLSFLNIPAKEDQKPFVVFFNQFKKLTKGLPATSETLARLQKVFLGQEKPEEVDKFGVVIFKKEE